MDYIIKTRVVKIEQLTSIIRVGKDGVKETEDLGWFVLFEHSHEHLFLGSVKPDLVVGQRIRIRIEADDAEQR